MVKCEFAKGKQCRANYDEKDCTKCMIPLFYKIDDMNKHLKIIEQRLEKWNS